MSATISLYPHRVSEQIALTLSSFEDALSERPIVVSGPPISSTATSYEATSPVYSLTTGADSWKRLAFSIEARLPPEQLQWILPPGVKPSEVTRLVVLITCPSTKVRRGIHLKSSSAGMWRGETVLSREDVGQRVLFTPQLLLTRDLEAPRITNGAYASKRAALLGSGERVRLELNPSSSVVTSSVEVLWEDFESSSNDWRRGHAHDVFGLSIEDRPVVYLNSRYHELRDILESTSKRGPQAAQRELTAALIAHPVLIQLSSIALLAVEFDELTQTATMPSGWRGDLLEVLLPSLYPGLASTEAALRRIGEDTRDPFTVADLFARLGSCTQRMISTHEAVETAIRAFEGTREGKDFDAE